MCARIIKKMSPLFILLFLQHRLINFISKTPKTQRENEITHEIKYFAGLFLLQRRLQKNVDVFVGEKKQQQQHKNKKQQKKSFTPSFDSNKIYKNFNARISSLLLLLNRTYYL